MAEYSSDLFRTEAIQHHAQYAGQGDVLRISPDWTQWSYWLLVGICVVGLLYVTFGKIYEYASGPAMVRVEGRTDLTAKTDAVVATLDVRPGQRVRAGQLLVRFDVAAETHELDRINREFELLLVRTLREPTDQSARQALTALRAQREQAEARLAARSVRATQDGIISDIRIRPGQHLAPGDVVLSLISDQARFWLLAILPGQYRPLLQPGMPLRLELSGYRYEYRELTIDSIDDEVVGPSEVRRYLPQESADAVVIQGPVVLVRAKLPAPTFMVDGHNYRYHDGMQGTGEARVRAESILVTLLPVLKALVHHDH